MKTLLTCWSSTNWAKSISRPEVRRECQPICVRQFAGNFHHNNNHSRRRATPILVLVSLPAANPRVAPSHCSSTSPVAFGPDFTPTSSSLVYIFRWGCPRAGFRSTPIPCATRSETIRSSNTAYFGTSLGQPKHCRQGSNTPTRRSCKSPRVIP